MKKKVLAMMLACITALSAVGCGQTEQPAAASGEEVKTEAQGTAEASEQGSAEVTPVDWTTPYEEPVTLHVAIAENTGARFQGEDDFSNNVWTRAYKEKLNIDIAVDWISSDYSTKMNLAIASGDLPDVFNVDQVQLKQLMDAGKLADLTEVYEAYASDRMKKMQGFDPDIMETAKRDGKLYGIPTLFWGYQPNVLWMRQDWLKEMGREFPTTVDELTETLEEMKTISGEYSFMADKTLSSLYGIANGWGAYPKMWIDDGTGKFIWGATAPEMKEAVATWAEWYQKGILKADFATMDGDAVKEDAVNGFAGADVCGSWWAWKYGADLVKNQGTEAYFMPCDVPTLSGEAAKYEMNFSNNKYLVVNKDCKNPEAVIKLINFYAYMLNDAYSEGTLPKDEVNKFIENGMDVAAAPFVICNPYDDYERHAMAVEAVEKRDESVCKTISARACYLNTVKWLEEKDADAFPYASQMGMDGCGMEVLTNIVEEDRIVKDKLWGAKPQELLDYGSTLDDILIEGFTKIIMGEEEVEYFDTLVESWYAAGGQTVTEAINATYGAQ